MRLLALCVLSMLVLAGCGQPGQEPDDLAVRIVFDERGTYYVGDAVAFRAQATTDVASWQWDLGDGQRAHGDRVVHAFEAEGTYEVTATATTLDGASGNATATIEILSLFGGPRPTPPGPSEPPRGDESGIVRLNLTDGEPTTGEPFAVSLAGPAMLGGGLLSMWFDGNVSEHPFAGLPAQFAMPAMAPGTHTITWLAQIEDEMYSGTLDFDVWGIPLEFGAPTSSQWLRPGVTSETADSACTVNFLFHYKWHRFFVGSAAHCVDGWGPATGEAFNPCGASLEGKIGSKVTLLAHDGRSAGGSVAYESWLTMDAVGESGGNVCQGNDFALIELGAKAQAAMHPAGLFFGGPNSMAGGGYGMGTTLYAYGASSLHGNVGIGYPGQDAVNRKQGISLGTDNGGYSQHVFYALPGIPGDSGGPAYGPGGEALGVASTITLTPTPGTNRYTVVAKALEYMLEHEGWAPELVVYDDWSPTG